MPKTARMRQKRAEGLSGGAGKGCYGKWGDKQDSKFASLKHLKIISWLIISTEIIYLLYWALSYLMTQLN